METPAAGLHWAETAPCLSSPHLLTFELCESVILTMFKF